MAKGERCIVTNCKNTITQGRKGLICGTHLYRKRQFGSYDLPDYKGIPNKPIYKILPPNMVMKCKIHGYLSLEKTYPRKYKENYHYKCKDCILGKQIKSKYKGLENLNDYDQMLEAQKGICGICSGPNNTTRNGIIKRFNIDHDHKTGKVRGLLCSFCNSLIGYAKDSIETLQSAIEYLKKHKECEE